MLSQAVLKIKITDRIVKYKNIYQSLTIGSDYSQDVSLCGPGIGCYHAQIRWEKDGYRLVEEPGGVATLLNKQTLQQDAGWLNHGDVITIGPYKMVFNLWHPPAAPLVIDLTTQLPDSALETTVLQNPTLLWRIPSDETSIKALEDLIALKFAQLPLSQEAQNNLALALHEALNNARQHGHHDNRAKILQVYMHVNSQEVILRVLDQGAGFNLEAELKPQPNKRSIEQEGEVYQNNPHKEQGIILMSHWVDEVGYNEHGNEVTLIKYLTNEHEHHLSHDPPNAGPGTDLRKAPSSLPNALSTQLADSTAQMPETMFDLPIPDYEVASADITDDEDINNEDEELLFEESSRILLADIDPQPGQYYHQEDTTTLDPITAHQDTPEQDTAIFIADIEEEPASSQATANSFPMAGSNSGFNNQGQPKDSAYSGGRRLKGVPRKSRAQHPVQRTRRLRGGRVTRTVQRKTTVHYFARMAPMRFFPLSVELSASKLPKQYSKKANRPGDKYQPNDQRLPYLDVVPHFPGCLVQPPKITLDITPPTSQAKFYITPLVTGRIAQAQIIIRPKYGELERIPTPCQVSPQTVVKFCLTGAVLGLFLVGVCASLNLPFKQNLPFYLQWVVHTMTFLGGPGISSLIGVILLLILAAYFYQRNRPCQAEPRLHFVTIGLPDKTEQATLANE